MDKRNSENFIMLPTVDFCFKELMQNPKVRQGFIAAIMGKDPKAIRKTTLIPNVTKKESKDAKLGILDVMVEIAIGDFAFDVVQRQRCRHIDEILCFADTAAKVEE